MLTKVLSYNAVAHLMGKKSELVFCYNKTKTWSAIVGKSRFFWMTDALDIRMNAYQIKKNGGNDFMLLKFQANLT